MTWFDWVLFSASLILFVAALLWGVTVLSGLYIAHLALRRPPVRKPVRIIYESRYVHVAFNGSGHGVNLSRRTYRFGRLQITQNFLKFS